LAQFLYQGSAMKQFVVGYAKKVFYVTLGDNQTMERGDWKTVENREGLIVLQNNPALLDTTEGASFVFSHF
jgi:hypothetical protein